MGRPGIEPGTSFLSGKRSTTEPTAQNTLNFIISNNPCIITLMPEPVYFVNNQFVPASKAQLHISDLAIMRGYGVFDFLITYNHRPFRLDDHLKRLKNSLKLIDLEPPKSLSQIKTLVLKTLEKNHSQEEKAVRIIVTLPAGKVWLRILLRPKIRQA